MKLKYFLIVFLLFLLSCHSQKNNFLGEAMIELHINEDEILLHNNFDLAKNEKVKLSFEFINKSEFDYMIVMDTARFFKYMDYKISDFTEIQNNDKDKQLFQLGYKVSYKKRLIDTGFDCPENYFNHLPPLLEVIKNNSFVIPKKGKIVFTKTITLPILSTTENKEEIKMFFLGDSMENLDFSIFLYQNKKLVQQNMSKEYEKEMFKNKIYLYDGIITSNKVPIKLIK